MAEDRDDPVVPDAHGAEWTSEDQAQLMARYEGIAAESATLSRGKGRSAVADFDLGGAVPRQEGNRGPFRSTDIYIRLENTIYGPVTQEELGEMLASGELTGFESASADLQHWTPLIYHPRMTLSGEIDPDATHDLLHNRSSLPAASRPSSRIDLEKLADDEQELVPSTPLAAILIKPVKISRKTGLRLPVHANLAEESIEHVIERTEIPEEQKLAGQQALDEIAHRAQELAAAGGLGRVGESADRPIVADFTDGVFDDTIDPTAVLADDLADDGLADSAVGAGTAREPAKRRADALGSPLVAWLVGLLVLAAAVVAAMTLLRRSTPEQAPPPEQGAGEQAPAE